MNALGMCGHNNWAGYCPSCLKENAMKGLGRLGSYSDFAGMGADCPTGYYEASIFGVSTGQCVPNLSTIVSGAQTGVLATVGEGVAQSPATQQAVQAGIASKLGTTIVDFYKNKPAIAWGVTGLAVLMFVYGGMSFVRGR